MSITLSVRETIDLIVSAHPDLEIVLMKVDDEVERLTTEIYNLADAAYHDEATIDNLRRQLDVAKKEIEQLKGATAKVEESKVAKPDDNIAAAFEGLTDKESEDLIP